MNFSPILNGYQAFTDGGIPLSGGLIYTYQAGTTTPQTAYFDSAGSVAHSNPIVLGPDGRPPGEIWLLETAAYKLSLFDSLLNPIDEWDNITGIESLTSSNWIPTGLGPIFLNASQFQVANNFVSTFPVGIRIQYFLTGTPFYGSVSAVTFSGGFTRVTVLVDSVPLNSGLDGVSVSALSPVNTSIPVVFSEDIRFNKNVDIGGNEVVSGNSSVTGTLLVTGLGTFFNGLSVGNSDVVSATVLDWYKEDVFTPIISFGGASVGVTYGINTAGAYTRIGNRVMFELRVQLTSKGSSTGAAKIGGLPFAAATSTVNEYLAQAIDYNNLSGLTGSLVPRVDGSATTISLAQFGAAAVAAITDTSFTNTSNLWIAGSYRV